MLVYLYLMGITVLTKEADGLKSLVMKAPEFVKSGDTITLSCTYDLENVDLYAIKWYRNEEEFYRYLPKESPPAKAFTAPQINVDVTKSGPNEVTMLTLRRELSGNYKCEVSSDAPLFHTEIKVAHIAIVDVPQDKPTLDIESKTVEKGKEIRANCSTSGSNPAANISWYINDEMVKHSEKGILISPTIHETLPGCNLETSESQIKLIASKTMFAMGPVNLKCRASLYTVWNQDIEDSITDDTAVLPPVLLSTSSQIQEEDNFEIFSRSNRIFNVQFLYLMSMILLILLIMNR